LDNARLAELEIAIERERRTMKRQELLRQIWKEGRSGKHEPSVSGQINTERADQREKPETHTYSMSPARGKSELQPDSGSTAV
jgi:DNA-binding response OmpR family regulator